ncbi:MAG: hypothetical protein FWF71_05045 [Actinomycetia bacterium]|nr:hypothetical protein [Actinomycetes bacterium]
MTRQDIIDYCLTLPLAYEDYPFDAVADDNACAVMRHQGNKNEEIKRMIDNSYDLIKPKVRRKTT